MRRKARVEWTSGELEQLKSEAGDYPASEIAEHLGKTVGAVKMQAKRHRISLRQRHPGQSWCPDCMQWRRATGAGCAVCNARRNAERVERQCQALERRLPKRRRRRFEQYRGWKGDKPGERAAEGAWVGYYERRYAAARSRLRRLRKALRDG